MLFHPSLFSGLLKYRSNPKKRRLGLWPGIVTPSTVFGSSSTQLTTMAPHLLESHRKKAGTPIFHKINWTKKTWKTELTNFWKTEVWKIEVLETFVKVASFIWEYFCSRCNCIKRYFDSYMQQGKVRGLKITLII